VEKSDGELSGNSGEPVGMVDFAVVGIEDFGYPPGHESRLQQTQERFKSLAEEELGGDDEPGVIVDDGEQIGLDGAVMISDQLGSIHDIGLPEVVDHGRFEGSDRVLIGGLPVQKFISSDEAMDSGIGEIFGRKLILNELENLADRQSRILFDDLTNQIGFHFTDGTEMAFIGTELGLGLKIGIFFPVYVHPPVERSHTDSPRMIRFFDPEGHPDEFFEVSFDLSPRETIAQYRSNQEQFKLFFGEDFGVVRNEIRDGMTHIFLLG